MATAIELFKQGGEPAGIFYCSECRGVHKGKESAEACHGTRVCSCGKERPRYYAICDSCRREEENAKTSERERIRFASARKIQPSEYEGGMIYLNDKFYDEVEDAIDQFLEGHEPEYVWGCINVGVPLADSESIVEHLLENMWEDADASDINGLDELDAAIAAFNEANKSIAVWQPDYSTAILIGGRP